MTATQLAGAPPETWGNIILFQIARELGYTPDENGRILVDPDSVLEEALEVIWMHKRGKE